MAGIISTVTSGVLTGRLHRGVLAEPIPDYIVPGARSEMLPSNDGLVVTIAAGTCVIGGCIVDFASAEQVTIAPVTGQKGYIVARLSLTAGTATIVQVQGTAPTINTDSLVNADTGVRDMIIAYYTTSSSAITTFVDRRQVGLYSYPQFTSTAAASTADKGTFDGCLAMGQAFDLILDNGNTAASPTITIGNTQYTFATMPNVAKLSTSGYQLYKYRKSGATTLSRITRPDYICERGDVSGWNYERWESGKAVCYGSPTVAITSSGDFGTGGLYMHNGTFEIPAGLFNATPVVYGCTHPGVSSVYATPSAYATSPTAGGIGILKTNSTGANVTEPIYIVGTWK